MGRKSFIVIGLLLVVGFFFIARHDFEEKELNLEINMENITQMSDFYKVNPVSHASFVLSFAGLNIFNDPVGEGADYQPYGVPDLVLISDVHRDHVSAVTIEQVIGEDTVIVAPQAVADELPEILLSQVTIMNNGDIETISGVEIEAIPMYNWPESSDTFHVKGRGNGYVLSFEGKRVYIAGDTSGTPEMRALSDIDVAFVPMNLPYTMSVEEAADAVLDFVPKQVYPYHYRGTEGLSDVSEFARLVNESNPDIEVVLLDWYKE